MVHIILQKIPHIVFEPVAILGLAGLFLLFLQKERRFHGIQFWFPVTGIFFMISWRLGIGIVSSRYASILIYPGIILTVFFCFEFGHFLRERFQLSNNWCIRIPRILFIGICIACLIQTFHYNRYEAYIRDSCALVKKDAARYPHPVLFVSQENIGRLKYYSGIQDTRILHNSRGNDQFTLKDWNDFLYTYRYFSDAIYFLIQERSGDAPLTAEQLNLEASCWKLLSQRYTNNREKTLLRVYRYTSGLPGGATLDKDEMDSFRRESLAYLLDNGDFEQESSSPLLDRSHLKWPAGWNLTKALLPAEQSQFGLSARSPLEGCFSLQMKGISRYIVYNQKFLQAGDYHINFVGRGIPGSEFSIVIYRYRPDFRIVGRRDIARFALLSGLPQRFSVSVNRADILPGTQFRIAVAWEQGNMWFDLFSAVPCNTAVRNQSESCARMSNRVIAPSAQ